jgi:hypothetical protein
MIQSSMQTDDACPYCGESMTPSHRPCAKQLALAMDNEGAPLNPLVIAQVGSPRAGNFHPSTTPSANP